MQHDLCACQAGTRHSATPGTSSVPAAYFRLRVLCTALPTAPSFGARRFVLPPVTLVARRQRCHGRGRGPGKLASVRERRLPWGALFLLHSRFSAWSPFATDAGPCRVCVKSLSAPLGASSSCAGKKKWPASFRIDCSPRFDARPSRRVAGLPASQRFHVCFALCPSSEEL